MSPYERLKEIQNESTGDWEKIISDLRVAAISLTTDLPSSIYVEFNEESVDILPEKKSAQSS